jgi:hypothetical protein
MMVPAFWLAPGSSFQDLIRRMDLRLQTLTGFGAIPEPPQLVHRRYGGNG